jgi:hypothetical protein
MLLLDLACLGALVPDNKMHLQTRVWSQDESAPTSAAGIESGSDALKAFTEEDDPRVCGRWRKTPRWAAGGIDPPQPGEEKKV